jgi:hypothetical protein
MLARGLEAAAVRVACPRCNTLAAVFLSQGGRLVLAWGHRTDGRLAAPSVVPEAAAVVACSCGCGAGLRIAVADVAAAMDRSVKGRPKRADATLA